uniref:Uncharacterized protein n=1 Tax=Anopheles farauti TaxID=69004 RepID=A0A182QSN2_9DIPT
MDIGSKTSTSKDTKATFKRRPFTITGLNHTSKPTAIPVPVASCSSLSKIHPLGTIPPYLRKLKQTMESTPSAPHETEESVEKPVQEDTPQTTAASTSVAVQDAEYRRNFTLMLERYLKELLVELGERDKRIRALEETLSYTHNTLDKLQKTIHAQLTTPSQLVMKYIPQGNSLIEDGRNRQDSVASEQSETPIN